MSKRLLLCCAFLFSTMFSFAQLLPPNQPEQDACNALLLCGTSFTSPYGYQGIGLTSDLLSTPCGGGEGNSMWLRIEVNTPGIIVFTIAPLTVTDDYDMAVIDITNASCSTFNASHVIRCNFNNNLPTFNNGITGLNTTSTLNFVAGGTTGSSYLQQINANAGDVYLIMINNFGTGYGGPLSGFTIDFAGSTATFNQPAAPQFDGLVAACDYSQEATIQLTEYVWCNSIAADGSDFALSPSGTIQSVSGINCTGTGGYTDKIKLTFAGTLPNGNYTLSAQTGTDGNTLLGFCDTELPLPNTINFTVGQDPIHILSIDSPACKTLKIHLSSSVNCNTIAPDGSDFYIEGPSSVAIASATGLGCGAANTTQTVTINLANSIAVDGNYQLKVKTGNDGNTLLGVCNRVVPVGESVGFTINSFNGQLTALPDTSICNTTASVTLYGINNGLAPAGGFQYSWTPTAGLSNPNSLTTTALINQGLISHYLLETIDANGCYLRDSNTIYLQSLTGKLNPKAVTACIGDSIPLFASGGSTYRWYDNPSFSGTPQGLDCPDCASPKISAPEGENHYYVVIANDIGCTDTLEAVVTVRPTPQLNVHPRDTTIDYGKSVQLFAEGAYQFTWYPSSTLSSDVVSAPIATPQKTTTYTVTGEDDYGCRGADSATVRLNYRSPVYLPNAFSPNGDGLNDVFRIENLLFQKLLVFQIFDRYGTLVFETTDPQKGWDGTYQGKPANPGVYLYYLRLGYPDNVIETFSGDVTLIR